MGQGPTYVSVLKDRREWMRAGPDKQKDNGWEARGRKMWGRELSWQAIMGSVKLILHEIPDVFTKTLANRRRSALANSLIPLAVSLVTSAGGPWGGKYGNRPVTSPSCPGFFLSYIWCRGEDDYHLSWPLLHFPPVNGGSINVIFSTGTQGISGSLKHSQSIQSSSQPRSHKSAAHR